MQAKCTATASWYCVHSKPRAETLAAEQLLRQGYECFLPRILRRAPLPRGGRSRSQIEPLFPRYLFVHADPTVQSLAAIRSTRGALGLVRFGGEPARVADDLVARLRRDADAQGVIAFAAPEFRPGGEVSILDGPFAGLRGIYVQRQGQFRVMVLLRMLGGEQNVLLDADCLQATATVRAA